MKRKCSVTRCNIWIEDENYLYRTCERCREKSRNSVRKLRSNPEKYQKQLDDNKERHHRKYKEDPYYRMACRTRRRKNYYKSKENIEWLEARRKKDREKWHKRKAKDPEFLKKYRARVKARRIENKLIAAQQINPIAKQWAHGMLEHAGHMIH